MSLHIQMSQEAQLTLERTRRRNQLSSFAASAGGLLLGGLIMFSTVLYVAMEEVPEFITYVPPAENAAPRPVPTTPQLTSKRSSPSSASVAPSVIVADTAAPIAMAQVDIPVDDGFGDGLSFDLGMGLGNGLGDGLGDGGEGLGSSSAGGSALVGSFYDLKQTKSGAPSGIKEGDTAKCMGVIKQFMGSWNENTFNKYFKAPTQLYISSFYIPQVSSQYAPESFQVQDRCKGSNWVALYRGRVKAPKSGKFRFLAIADETMLVRFDNKLVLEAGYRIPSSYTSDADSASINGGGIHPHAKVYRDTIKAGKDSKHKGYEFFTYPEIPTYNKELDGLTAGSEFTVKEGQSYPIEILIGDFGGAFGFFLCIQDTTNGKEKPAVPDLFRTNFSVPGKEELQKVIPARYTSSASQYLRFNKESPIWVAVP